MANYKVPVGISKSQIKVLNSQFIGILSYVSSVEEAREFIKTVKGLYPDASHHVPAFVIGYGNSIIEHQSDDGEPAGTAGMPVLSVLRGADLGDSIIVVTRYFGGIKLGTGGLVRAYTDAAKAVLSEGKLGMLSLTNVFGVEIPYSQYESYIRELSALNARVEEEVFAEKVSIKFRIDATKSSEVLGVIKSHFYSLNEPKCVAQNEQSIIPL